MNLIPKKFVKIFHTKKVVCMLTYFGYGTIYIEPNLKYYIYIYTVALLAVVFAARCIVRYCGTVLVCPYFCNNYYIII